MTELAYNCIPSSARASTLILVTAPKADHRSYKEGNLLPESALRHWTAALCSLFFTPPFPSNMRSACSLPFSALAHKLPPRSSANKATVQAFIDGLCTSPLDTPKIASLFGPVYRANHLPNPPFEGSAEQFLTFLSSMIPEGHAPSIKVRRMVEEGDQVWVWSTVSGMGPTKESVDMWVCLCRDSSRADLPSSP